MVKIYKHGKDRESLPCVELDDGTLITILDVIRALFKENTDPTILKVKQAINRHDLLPTYENMVNWLTLTPSQLDAYIDSNITDLVSARTYLKKLSRATLFLLQRELKP